MFPSQGFLACLSILPELQGLPASAPIVLARGLLEYQLPKAPSHLPHTQKHHPQLFPTPAPLHPWLVPPMAPATKSMDSVENRKNSGLSV